MILQHRTLLYLFYNVFIHLHISFYRQKKLKRMINKQKKLRKKLKIIAPPPYKTKKEII